MRSWTNSKRTLRAHRIRGVHASALDEATRLLAAGDVAVALGERRPHLPPHPPSAIVQILAQEVDSRHLDRRSVGALTDSFVGAEGKRRTPQLPDALSDRKVEVLVLVARGATNKDIARCLGITAKTVAHHVAHIYAKTGLRSRAGASLYALERHLL